MSKGKHCKSDRIPSQVESLRVGTESLGLSQWGLSESMRNDRSLQTLRGGRLYSTGSCLCACGKPALRVWKNIGYCKAYAPRRVS